MDRIPVPDFRQLEKIRREEILKLFDGLISGETSWDETDEWVAREQGKAFQEFDAGYRFEEENGHSHRVDGRLATHAGSVNRLLADIMGTKEL